MMIGRLILCRNQSIGQSVSFLIAYSFPCYNGRYSRRAMKELMLVMKVCLNPYSNGTLSDILKESALDFSLPSSFLQETRFPSESWFHQRNFSQMYQNSTLIPNKNEGLFA